VVLCADIPHRRLRPADQDQKQALGDFGPGQIFFREVVLALPCRTVDHGNVMGFGITANATAEPVSRLSTNSWHGAPGHEFLMQINSLLP
jgi:hypothetical protein